MNKGPIAVLLMLSLFWTLGGVGELLAIGPGAPADKDLEDIPSTEEFVAMGVAAAIVLALIVWAIVSSGDDDEAGEQEGGNLSENGDPSPQLRIDPVLTWGRDTLGAGLAFSF